MEPASWSAQASAAAASGKSRATISRSFTVSAAVCAEAVGAGEVGGGLVTIPPSYRRRRCSKMGIPGSAWGESGLHARLGQHGYFRTGGLHVDQVQPYPGCAAL